MEIKNEDAFVISLNVYVKYCHSADLAILSIFKWYGALLNWPFYFAGKKILLS